MSSSISDFRDLALELGLVGERFEISWTKGGYQAAMRVGRALYIGLGTSDLNAMADCLAKAQLSKGWTE